LVQQPNQILVTHPGIPPQAGTTCRRMSARWRG